jgi:hypothetical protein
MAALRAQLKSLLKEAPEAPQQPGMSYSSAHLVDLRA